MMRTMHRMGQKKVVVAVAVAFVVIFYSMIFLALVNL